MTPHPPTDPARTRLDKWLWAARFFKHRTAATEAVDGGKVKLNGITVKPAREVKPGDTVRLRQARDERVVLIKALSPQRGPATVAQQLYEETPESIAARAQATEARRLAPEPAHALAQGRPTKRDRRAIDGQRRGDWGDRWSATLDE